MDAFADVQFPTDVAYGTSGGPEFLTEITEALNGYETRNAVWSQARARYVLGNAVKSPAQIETVLAFFRARAGRAQGFRFKDWADYRATEQVIAVGNGVQTQFQLCKHYVSGGISHTRRIDKPVLGSVSVRINQQPVSPEQYSVNTSNGVISFASAPANQSSIYASFEFDVPVRFDSDAMQIVQQDHGVQLMGEIALVELRLPAPLLA